MVKNIIAYGGGILALVAVFLLLRRVCKELFQFGRRQQPEEQPANKSEKYLPVILPAVLSCVMLAVYAVISSYNGGGRLGPQGTLSDFRIWLLCIVSSLFYIGGSVLSDLITREIMYKHLLRNEKWRASEAGIRASIFFCIAPFSVLMVLPYRYSAAVFFLLAAYYAYQKAKSGWSALCLAGALAADELSILVILGFAVGLLCIKIEKDKKKRGFLLAGIGLLLFLLRELIFCFLFDMPFTFFSRFGQPLFFAELILLCFPLYIYGARRIRNENGYTALWTAEGILCGFVVMAQATSIF